MYKIEHKISVDNSLDYVELTNSENDSNAKVYLNLGGSLQVLSLNKKSIINGLSPQRYEETYASAILFPFTNRIKNGTYTFQDKDYTLNLNLEEENSAIHGLVYNKTFQIISKETTDDIACLKIGFTENKKTKGFPFKYSIQLTYTLSQDILTLNVEITNTDNNPFPFNIGWHPYFYSSNLFDSKLSLNSNKKLVFNEEMIPIGVNDIVETEEIQIKNKHFDDCYILNSKSIQFRTPDHQITLSSSSNENYLQVYTPNNSNAIAIEPKTGPSNSFNNKLGLNILKPNENHQVSWTITLNENE